MTSEPGRKDLSGRGSEELASVAPSAPSFSEDDIQTIMADVEASLRAGVLTKGPHVEALEAEVAASVGDCEAIAVNSATSGLEGLYRAIEVGGGEVIVPAHTFVASASAVHHAGGDVRFVDIEPQLLGPSRETLEAAVTPRTRAVVLCHMGGVIAPNVIELVGWCRENGLFCIEDAAQAQGAALGGRVAGSFGDAAVFSYFPTKVVTGGEGGVVTTTSGEVAEAVRALRDQGRDASKVHRYAGFNWRMTELQAIVARTQVRRLREFIERRRRIAETYSSVLSTVERLTVPSLPPDVAPNWYKYWVVTDSPALRDHLIDELHRRHGLRYAGPLQGHTDPCHTFPPFARYGASCPHTERFCLTHLGLPIYPDLPLSTGEAVAAAVLERVEHASDVG